MAMTTVVENVIDIAHDMVLQDIDQIVFDAIITAIEVLEVKHILTPKQFELIEKRLWKKLGGL